MTQRGKNPLKPLVARKLDGGLRRLLSLSEADIRRHVRNEHARLARMRRQATAPRRATGARPGGMAPTVQLSPHPVWSLIEITRGRFRPIRIRAITHFTGNRTDLTGLGLTVRSQAQDIFTIEGTPNELRKLAAQPATRALRLPRMLVPNLDNATAQAGIADVHQPRPANPTGYRGNGIIMGIVDTPLDVRHPAFREAANPHPSRVLYYWVQGPDSAAAPGQTPEGFNAAFSGLNYGRLYTQAQINAALSNAAGAYGNGANQISKMLDPNGEHGTATAGIAAGNGQNAGYTVGPYVGAAPDATMIHVGVNAIVPWADAYSGAWEDRFVDAIDFIFRAAQLHSMPAAVNVSWGAQTGPHDGGSLFDQHRDNLLNSHENRSIVWSAGNDNDDNGFTRGTIGPTVTVSLTLTPTSASTTRVFLDIWYSGPVVEIELQRGASTSGWITAGNEFHNTIGGHMVDIERDPEPSSGYHGIRFYIQSTDATQLWTINLRNPHGSDTVSYSAWTGFQGSAANLSNPVHDVQTLSDTGCARSVITVGGCEKVFPPNVATGEPIAAYSGAGPTLDGRIKPEVTAVGGTFDHSIMTADSTNPGGYTPWYETSMASPLVGGLVALLMEERKNAAATIDQDTIKGLLTMYANRLNLHLDPGQPGYVETDRNRYGYGRVRAIGPIDHHLPPQSVDVYVKTAPDDYGLVPYIGDVYWAAPEIKVCPQGSTVPTNQLQWGHTYDVTVTVRNLGNDTAVGTDVWLKYTVPYAAPNEWTDAQDTSNTALHATVTVPALGHADAHFTWRPDSGEVPLSSPDGHYCVLAEVGHLNDPLTFPAPTGSGGSAWESNVKGTNNVALHNVNIQ